MRDMKDSGVAWIGAVPVDFGTASIGSLFTIKKDIIGQEPETVLSITQSGIRPKDLSSNEGQNASSYAHYQIVNVGNFAMNHMDLLTGWIDISKYDGVTSPDYRVFSLNDKEMSADYFLRVFQYYYTNKVFFGFGQGVATLGRWRLPAINFKKIDVPVPPILEQQRIISAIDENIGKVDALIANVHAQIEKLKAYKQSVITEVVTKGIDHTVPMKDSGVEWIGEIPAHWGIGKVRYLATFHNGDRSSKYPKPDELQGEGIPFLTSSNLNKDSLDLTECKYLTREKYVSLGGAKIQKGDIIFCLRGSIGKCAINFTEDEGTVASSLVAIRPTSCVPEFLLYFFFSNSALQQTGVCMNGTCAANLSAENVGNYLLAIPNEDEQKQIASYLNQKCSQVDRLIAIKQAKIEKLEQYKRSLIYEYVTGKREVV